MGTRARLSTPTTSEGWGGVHAAGVGILCGVPAATVDAVLGLTWWQFAVAMLADCGLAVWILARVARCGT